MLTVSEKTGVGGDYLEMVVSIGFALREDCMSLNPPGARSVRKMLHKEPVHKHRRRLVFTASCHLFTVIYTLMFVGGAVKS